MSRGPSLGAGSVATLLAMSASGCWLVWGIEPLSEETGTGGASTSTESTTSMGGAGPGTGGAPQGGGGGGGAPPEVGCHPAVGTDNSFKLLTVCKGFVPRRIAAAEDRLVVTGDVGAETGEAFVKVFDLSGNETASMVMADALETSVYMYKTAEQEKRIVLGGNYETGKAPELSTAPPPGPCTGERCGFVAVLDYGLEPVWAIEWLDPGASGRLEVNGVDVARVEAHADRHFISIAGSFHGLVTPFDAKAAMSATSPSRSYIITADVEGNAPSGAHHMVRGVASRGRESAIHIVHAVPAPQMLVTTVGSQGDNATLHTLLAELDTGGWYYDFEPGEFIDISRTGTGFSLARVVEQQVDIQRYDVISRPEGPQKESIVSLAIDGGRVAGSVSDDIYVAGGFRKKNITIGTTLLSNAGDGTTRDMVLVHIDPNHAISPHVLQESSPDEATIEDVASSPSNRVFFVASFHGVIHFGGQTLTAAPEGSMLIGELVD